VAKRAARVVEKKKENTLTGTAVMNGLQAGHESSATTDGTLSSHFRERNSLPNRGEDAIHCLKSQLEFEGKTGAAELLVRVLAQKGREVTNVTRHPKFSASDKLGVSTQGPS